MLTHLIASLYFNFSTWRFSGHPSLPPKFVAIGAPHTSNWDFFYMLMIAWQSKRKAYWIGKHTLFKPPFGFFMRFLGGIPVDRGAPQNTVEQILLEMQKKDEFFLVITPEGTRDPVEFWKSGFYHIAREAGIPIVLGYADYQAKECGLGPLFYPTDDIEKDFQHIREFYAPIQGKFQELFNIDGIRPRK